MIEVEAGATAVLSVHEPPSRALDVRTRIVGND